VSSDQKFKFYTPVKVRFDDTDLQGHVYFGQYYSFFDEGIEGYLAAIGYEYQAMLHDNTDFLYVESHCTYKSSAKWPEILNVYTRIGHIGRRSLRFDFEITAQNDNRLVATGYIAAVTANRNTFTPHAVPDGMRQAVAAYEGELLKSNPD
jgi:acyl-CoA thioester hydrolase